MYIDSKKGRTVVLLQNKKMWSCSFEADGSRFSNLAIISTEAQVKYIKRKVC